MKATERHPYPDNFEEFLDWFSTDEDCEEYLEWVRWSNGFTCPKCGHTSCWNIQNKIRRCGKCRQLISVTNGTVFASSKKSLRLWFYVIWLLMAQKTGVSAQNLQDTFGFGSYQTIWGWLQKLRSVMIREGRERLSGRIELDETYIGGQQEGKRGRGAACKVLVLVAVEGYKRARLGRVRFRIVEKATYEAITRFVSDYIEPGSIVVTDGLKSYQCLNSLNVTHEQQILSHASPDVASNLEHVHLVISLVKRWMLGTLQGAVTPAHMAGYLDEFAFRFNRRLSTHRGKLFYRLIQQAISARPKNIKDLYVHK